MVSSSNQGPQGRLQHWISKDAREIFKNSLFSDNSSNTEAAQIVKLLQDSKFAIFPLFYTRHIGIFKHEIIGIWI